MRNRHVGLSDGNGAPRRIYSSALQHPHFDLCQTIGTLIKGSKAGKAPPSL
jgi:hypothetical protein